MIKLEKKLNIHFPNNNKNKKQNKLFKHLIFIFSLCIALACPDPGTGPGLYRNGTIELSETVIYNCIKPGYQLVGDKNRTCVYFGEKNGTGWTGSIPICKGED